MMAKERRSHIMLDSPTTAWTDLPEYVLAAVVERIQGDREVSAIFRRVCPVWRETHDRLVTVLKPNGIPGPRADTLLHRRVLPQDAREWGKFGGVRTLHLKASLDVNDDVLRALAPLTGLTSLDLSGCVQVTDEGLRAALAPLARLTSLNLAYCSGLTDKGVRALLPPFTTLTSLNLADCCGVTNEGVKALGSLTALTSLNLASCNRLTDEAVRAQTQLRSLTSLNLTHCHWLSNEGVRALASLTALTSLYLSGCNRVTKEGLKALTGTVTVRKEWSGWH
jgi:bacterioferritin-associated ferredoxin